jgi:PPM family protein phosphatase
VNNVVWEYGLSTHRGNVKENNEDRALIRFSSKSNFCRSAIALVADGMGGYQAGETASQLAVDELKKWWDHSIERIMNDSLSFQDIKTNLSNTFDRINEKLLLLSYEEGIRAGTTLSIILFHKTKYIVAHVGDSRIYQIGRNISPSSLMETVDLSDDGKTVPLNDNDETVPLNELEIAIQQITEDHSWVETQVRKGLLSKEDARVHSKRNILLQCLGIEGTPNAFVIEGNLVEDSLYLLCSDGFYSLFSDEEIQGMIFNLLQQYDLQRVSEELVKVANEHGATDNITVVLLKQNIFSNENDTGFKKIVKTIFKK